MQKSIMSEEIMEGSQSSASPCRPKVSLHGRRCQWRQAQCTSVHAKTHAIKKELGEGARPHPTAVPEPAFGTRLRLSPGLRPAWRRTGGICSSQSVPSDDAVAARRKDADAMTSLTSGTGTAEMASCMRVRANSAARLAQQQRQRAGEAADAR